MIRVFIADDHSVVRHGLKLMLEASDMVVVGTAADGHAVLRAPAIDACDVLILDLSLPRIGGAEVLRQIRSRLPDLPIVILSMYPEDEYALHLLREGASAYLSKDRPPEELVAALRKAAAGGSYVTDTLAEHALRGHAAAPSLPHTRLSPREQQVFRLLVEGRSVSEIAAEINVSMSTVSNHLRHIKEKLGARTVAEVIGYAHRVGLLGAGPRGPDPH